MPRNSNIEIPIRILDSHNKIVQRAGSKESKERVSRKVFDALRQQFYDRTDARARSNPASLHHVYEWGKPGDPSARLYKFTSRGRGTGAFEVSYDYLESREPNVNGDVFAEKARVMEEGIPVTIAPVNSERLAFEVDGEMVYTAGPVTVTNPGGDAVRGSLRQEFMSVTTPSALARNAKLQEIFKTEMSRVMSQIRRARG
jgi:hypothetical protein